MVARVLEQKKRALDLLPAMARIESVIQDWQTERETKDCAGEKKAHNDGGAGGNKTTTKQLNLLVTTAAQQ